MLHLPLPYTLLNSLLGLLLGLIGLPASAADQQVAEYAPGSYQHADKQLQSALKRRLQTGRARGVILFIGDGMSIATVTAGRIYTGQQRGGSGEEHQLSFEKFPQLALSKTYNSNQQTPDSAGTMTAMISGEKTKAGVIGLDSRALRASTDSCRGHTIETLLERAEDRGWATGIVTTTALTHATPAAAYAHSPERNWESDADLPANAADKDCRDIATQLIEFDHGDGLEVALGGGRQQFLPREQGGLRRDGRNLINEWQQRHPDGHYLDSASALSALSRDDRAKKKPTPLLGLFASSHLSFEGSRATDSEEPSLEAMLEVALQQLQRQRKFLLIVEGGRIDHAHHAGNAYHALEELLAFERAVARADALTADRDTLLIVTADHSHTLTMAGYPTRGNPILGFVKGNDDSGQAEEGFSLAADQKPYTTLSYANGRGYHNQPIDKKYGSHGRYMTPIQVGRHTTADDDPQSPHYHQEANVPLMVETHAGDDVAIYAQGPWAHLLNGVVEQNYIYHVMRHAMGL